MDRGGLVSIFARIVRLIGNPEISTNTDPGTDATGGTSTSTGTGSGTAGGTATGNPGATGTAGSTGGVTGTPPDNVHTVVPQTAEEMFYLIEVE